MDNSEIDSALLQILVSVGFSAGKLLELFRQGLKDKEAEFLDSFNLLPECDRIELILHLSLAATSQNEETQEELSTVIPIVAQMAEIIFDNRSDEGSNLVN